MLLPIKHATWQALRAVARSRKPVPGSDLRIAWTRQTRDGSFLTELVRVELLEVVDLVEGKPFDSRYKLTEAGKYAAEFGEYECDLDHVAASSQQNEKTAGRLAAAKQGKK